MNLYSYVQENITLEFVKGDPKKDAKKFTARLTAIILISSYLLAFCYAFFIYFFDAEDIGYRLFSSAMGAIGILMPAIIVAVIIPPPESIRRELKKITENERRYFGAYKIPTTAAKKRLTISCSVGINLPTAAVSVWIDKNSVNIASNEYWTSFGKYIIPIENIAFFADGNAFSAAAQSGAAINGHSVGSLAAQYSGDSTPKTVLLLERGGEQAMIVFDANARAAFAEWFPQLEYKAAA